MKLSELLLNYKYDILYGDVSCDVINIAYDSRKVKENYLFICIEGYKTDGHSYASIAVENGSNVLIVQKEINIEKYNNLKAIIKVEDTRECFAYISSIFFGLPSKDFYMVGVTGTKGKTTTTYMIKSIFEKYNEKVGLVGTIRNMIGNEILPTDKTTPESYDLQNLFVEMKSKSINSVVMEVSSHALDLYRVGFINYDIGIFTNLSRDHLDFHHNFENYLNAKIKLFNQSKIGLVNIDNEYGEEVVKRAKCKVYTMGINKDSDIMAYDIVEKRESVEFKVRSIWGNSSFKINVPGRFMVYNALASIATALIRGIEFNYIKEALSNISVPGRAELVDIKKDYSIIIDYSHTPDSLENILKTMKDFVKGKLICVFGCGGDRDKTKRPIMGEISAKLADFTIITSDNPRTEDPDSIINEIEIGVKNNTKNYVKITDRRLAIKHSMMIAKKDDIVILAGKGHETYQIFKDKTIHFDEREVIFELLTELENKK